MPRIVLITGGTGGIGRATADMLRERGDTVIMVAPECERLYEVAAAHGSEALACDVTDAAQCDAVLQQVVDTYGGLDVLINAAGVYTMGSLTETSVETIDAVFDVNVRGTMYMTRAAVPALEKQPRSVIVNLVSRAATRARADRSIYYSSKWAIRGFTKCMRAELAPKGIKVAGLYPDHVKTALFDRAGVEKDLSSALEPRDVARSILHVIDADAGALIGDMTLMHINNV